MKSVFALTLLASSLAHANVGVHISDSGCGMLNSEGISFYTTETQITGISTPTGRSILKCITNDVRNPTGQSIFWNHDNTSYLCYTPEATTRSWSETINTAGTAILTCIFQD